MSDNEQDLSYSTSTGHAMADKARLDKHYLAAKSEYEQTILATAIQANWHVLDAGCGNGVFLPYIADMVGAKGKVSAIDLAPENVEAVNAYADRQSVPCIIETKVGSLTELPYESRIFDAVWCANVTQYFTDDELHQVLSEFSRVLRPSGLAAIKEVDISFWQYQPLEPGLIVRWVEWAKNQADSTQIRGALRGPRIPARMRAAGFDIVKRRTFLVERWSPLTSVEREFITDNLSFMASIAADSDLSVDDRSTWARILESPDSILNDPDFCYREIHVLSVGVSPS